MRTKALKSISWLLLLIAGPVCAALHVEAVYLYDLQGTTLDAHFQRQNDVHCDIGQNEVYVADTGNRCVRIFGKEGMQVFQFGQTSGVSVPLAVTTNIDGDIYVLQGGFGGRRIDRFDFRGKQLSGLALSGLPEGEACRPDDLALDSGENIYISDQTHGCIFSFDPEGRYRFQIWPEMPEKEREEVVFGNLMIDDQDRVYLPVSTIGSVYVFDPEGRAVRAFGMRGGGPGKLAFPVDVVADMHGHFFVLDKMRHTVVVYDGGGRYLTEFGGMGTGPGWFFYPDELEIDRFGRIYVSQRFGNKVQVLKIKEETR
jgi:sugar lactone lactonase YvrE